MQNAFTQVMRLSRAFALPMVLSFVALYLALPLTTSVAFAQSNACGKDVQCIINFGNQRIAERNEALNTLSGKVTAQLNAKHITSDQANVLQADVSSNLANLATLQQKLDAETTASAARQDVQNIYLQFRIFAVVLPRDYREIHTDIAANLTAYLKHEETELQQQIANAPAAKQQRLNTLYADYAAHVADAETQVDTALAGFPTLTPSTYNTNRSAYNTALASVTAADHTAHNDLHRAVSDLNQMNALLG